MRDRLANKLAPWLSQDLGPFISGELLGCGERDEIQLVDPAIDEPFAKVYGATTEDVEVAVSAASSAMIDASWNSATPADRANWLLKIADCLTNHSEELAALESFCMGKPYIQALKGEIPFAASVFRYYAGAVMRIGGKQRTLSKPGLFHAYTLRQPIGPVAAIVPFNGPLVIAAWKIAPALAAGCSVIVKPALKTPLSVLRLAQLITDAGIPKGMVGVLPGYGETVGSQLGAHPRISMITCTASTDTGRKLVRSSADTNLKRVMLELGGKSPLIVFADADLKAAVSGAIGAIFGNAGQTCVAGSRILVHHEIASRFTDDFCKVANRLQIGDPFEAATEMGPVVSNSHRQKIHELVSSSAGTCLTGGVVPSGIGAYYPPTVCVDVSSTDCLWTEEVFGPVAVIAEFSSDNEALVLANNSNFGLAASVWTRDLVRAHKISADLNSGIVWVNTHNLPDPSMPIGGKGQSGWGRELGEEGLDPYLETKSIMMNLNE